MSDYDVCVIGAGPAGFAAAMRAWDFGKRVALIEKAELGGSGVHNGALSSKTMWELSRDYRNATRRDRGFVANELEVHYAATAEAVETATQSKVAQMARQLKELHRPRPGCPGSINLIHGNARFIDANHISIDGGAARTARTLSASDFIIATGSRPRQIPSIEVDGHTIMTSDHIGSLEQFPRSLVILGAGVVGCEFATIFSNFGQTKVNLIDRAERILPFEDADISRLCSTNLEAKGVTIHHRAKLIDMRRVNGQVEYTIEHSTGGRETIQVEKAMISIGRVPNTDSLGLDAIGVELNERGYIEDEDARTNVPNIWAVGDITPHAALVSVGEIEGRHAAERICGATSHPLSYDNLSTIMFLDPEVAAIGLNEQEAQKRRIAVTASPTRASITRYRGNVTEGGRRRRAGPIACPPVRPTRPP